MNNDMYDYIDGELNSLETMNNVKLKLFLTTINNFDDKSNEALNTNRNLIQYIISHYDSSNVEINTMINTNIKKKNFNFYTSYVITTDNIPINYDKNVIFLKSFFDITLSKAKHVTQSYIDKIFNTIDDKTKFRNFLLYYSTKKSIRILFETICNYFEFNFFISLFTNDIIVFDKTDNFNKTVDLSLDELKKLCTVSLSFVISDSQKNIILNISNNFFAKNTIDFDANLCANFIDLSVKINSQLLPDDMIKNIIDKYDLIFMRSIVSHIVDMKNINLIKYAMNSKNNNAVEKIFDKIIETSDIIICEDSLSKYKFTSIQLEKACRYKNLSMIVQILNNKIMPEQKHFNILASSLSGDIEKKLLTTQCILLLFEFGYKLTYDDVILAAKHKINLPEQFEKFEFNPNKTFYSYCDLTFKPKYNDNLYNDELWIERISTMKLKAEHLRDIMKIVKNNKIKLSDEIIKNLSKQNETKQKKELMNYLNDIAIL
jgi:hypothetical protein